jgi:hypothetical protein
LTGLFEARRDIGRINESQKLTAVIIEPTTSVMVAA